MKQHPGSAVHHPNGGGGRRARADPAAFERAIVCGMKGIAVFLVFVTAAAVSAQKSSIPRTSDGHPDLEGTWSYATLTTLERPAEFKDKPFLTPQEAVEFEKRTLQVQDRDRRDVDTSTGRGSDGRTDVDRAYNQAWWEFGSKIVGTRRTSLVIDPPDGMIPALTPDGARRAQDKRGLWLANGNYEGGASGTGLDSYTDRPMQERCLAWTVAGPPMIPGAYNNNVGIFQTADQVVILNEMVHDHRVIPLAPRPRVGDAIRLWMGSSQARWEGDTLVVSTTNFRPMVFRSASEKFTLTERFTLVDANTLMYEFTVNDPLTWVKPWTVQFPMVRMDEPLYEYACHEGNYSLPNILRAARNAEREGRERAR
jgi:hypothetical protein